MSEDLRKTVLTNLLALNGSLESIKSQLTKFPWDSDRDVVTLRTDHLERVLRKYVDQKLTAEEVVEWANLIELREDIGFDRLDEDIVKKILFELANPEINNAITPSLAINFLKVLNRKLI